MPSRRRRTAAALAALALVSTLAVGCAASDSTSSGMSLRPAAARTSPADGDCWRSGMSGEDWDDWDSWGPGMGPGMMDRDVCSWGPGMMSGHYWLPGDGTPVRTLDQSRQRADTFADRLGLRVGEVMQFSKNFYAELQTPAGRLATEILIDPADGDTGIEYGPAMMWNTDYGMHHGEQAPDPYLPRPGPGPWRDMAAPTGQRPDRRSGRGVPRLLHAAHPALREDHRHAVGQRLHRCRMGPQLARPLHRHQRELTNPYGQAGARRPPLSQDTRRSYGRAPLALTWTRVGQAAGPPPPGRRPHRARQPAPRGLLAVQHMACSYSPQKLGFFQSLKSVAWRHHCAPGNPPRQVPTCNPLVLRVTVWHSREFPPDQSRTEVAPKDITHERPAHERSDPPIPVCSARTVGSTGRALRPHGRSPPRKRRTSAAREVTFDVIRIRCR